MFTAPKTGWILAEELGKNNLHLMKLTTPFSHMTDIRSSTPFTPLGIFVKSSRPRAFWQVLKVQLSVPVVVRSSL